MPFFYCHFLIVMGCHVSLLFAHGFDHFLLYIQDQASDVDVLLADADGTFHSIKVRFTF